MISFKCLGEVEGLIACGLRLQGVFISFTRIQIEFDVQLLYFAEIKCLRG